LFLGGSVSHGAVLALVAGVAATIGAVIVRNALVHRKIGVGPDDTSIPTTVAIYGLIASIAGSLAGLEVAILLHEAFPVWIGTLAGLMSSISMGLLMVTYHARHTESSG
jgi:hypothetical protein